jgi:ATP-dependent protease HslVU (ClpYQ) peptidase subunit
MGADSGGSDEESELIMNFKAPKVFIKDKYIVGYAGSYRFGKLMQHVFELPPVPSNLKTSEQLDKFMNSTLMTSLRKQSKELDLDKDELDFDCIIGVNGHIFEVSNDWFALEPVTDFLATGSGIKYALGSLYTTNSWKNPIQRINVALNASAEYSMSVSGPFTVICT